MKMTLHHHPPTYQLNGTNISSYYWPDFNQTLKVGSCDYIELIPSVMVIFVQTTYVLATFINIRNISAVTDLIGQTLKVGSWDNL